MNARATLVIAAAMLLPAVATAQPVALADLQGAVVEATVVNQQDQISNGKEGSRRVQQDWRYVIGPGERVQYHSVVTSVGRGGSRSSTPETGNAGIGRPGQTSSMGGGDGLWVFENSTLTFLRTYRGEGGYRRSISFRRNGAGFNCTVTTAFARENGRGAIRFTSPVDGSNLELRQVRTLSTRCKVSASR